MASWILIAVGVANVVCLLRVIQLLGDLIGRIAVVEINTRRF